MELDQVAESGIFPDQIITKILTRLPAKSITRFKSVSKRWNSMICNPQFLSSYISATSPTWSIFDRFIRVNPEPDESYPELKVHWQQPPNVSYLSVNLHKLGDDSKEFSLDGPAPAAAVLNSRNGLLLFSIKVKREPYWEMRNPDEVSLINKDDSLYVVNPVTHDWVSIPIAPVPLNRQDTVGFVTQVGPTGVLERFMVVDYQPLIVSDIGKLLCFSSETWKWERISSNYMLGEHIWRAKDSFEVDGHLFWVDLRVGIIVWDDPFGGEGEVRLRYIALPTQSNDWVTRRCVDVSGGEVQYLEATYEGSHVLKLWRLIDYENGEWSLVSKVSFKDIWYDPTYLAHKFGKVMPFPYLMHPFEAHISFFMVGNRVFSMDVGDGKVKSCCDGFKSMFKALDKYISLDKVTLPSWPTSFSPSLKATFFKEQGNIYFKAENFNEAITYYSRSIALSQNVLTYANRAMVYLKVGRYHEAEVDCTEALKLDGEYFKAYAHRALARQELGDLIGFVEDVEFALKLKPDDQGMKMLYAEMKMLIEKVRPSGPMPTAPPVHKDSSMMQPTGAEDEFDHEGGR